MTAGMRGRLAAVRQRATDSRGLALTEMIVVLAILVVVLTALTQLFVSASTAEVDMSNRVQAQQDARLALDKLRREIHCAKEVTLSNGSVSAQDSPRRRSSSAPTARRTPLAPRRLSRGARRTRPVARRRLQRSLHALALRRQHVLGNRRRKWADYLTTGGRCSRSTHRPAGGLLGTLSVDLPVDLKPADAKQRYTLQDDIVLRNTPRS